MLNHHTYQWNYSRVPDKSEGYIYWGLISFRSTFKRGSNEKGASKIILLTWLFELSEKNEFFIQFRSQNLEVHYTKNVQP